MLLVAGLVGVVAFGCGGDDADEPTPAGTEAPTAATVVAFTEMSCPDGTTFRISDQGWWVVGQEDDVHDDVTTSGEWSMSDICDQP